MVKVSLIIKVDHTTKELDMPRLNLLALKKPNESQETHWTTCQDEQKWLLLNPQYHSVVHGP